MKLPPFNRKNLVSLCLVLGFFAAACVVLSLFDALSPISALALAGCRIVSSLVLYFVSRSRFGPAAEFGEADRAEPDPPKSNDEEKEQHVAVIP